MGLKQYAKIKYELNQCGHLKTLVPEYKAITDSIKAVDSLTIQNIKIQVRKKDEQIELLQVSNEEAKHLIVRLDKQNKRLKKSQKVFKIGTITGAVLSVLLLIL